MHAAKTQRLFARWTRLGLRHNPFQVVDPARWDLTFVSNESEGVHPPDWLCGPERVVQITGQTGWGKSTWLAAARRCAESAGCLAEHHYLRAPGPYRLERPAAHVRVLLLDEAERLQPISWQSLLEATRPEIAGDAALRLLVTVHSLLPVPAGIACRVVRIPEVTVVRLQQLVEGRIAWAGGDSRQWRLAEDAAEWLIEQGRGNLRLIEAMLFEWFQTLSRRPDPWDLGALNRIGARLQQIAQQWPD